MKTKLDIVATAAIRKSGWLTRCKVPKCDLIASQEMCDTTRKIEDNLEMYWFLSGNDKKVTDFRQEMQCVEDAGLYLVLVCFATGIGGTVGPPTCVGGREGGRDGGEVRPFLFSTENSHIVAHSLRWVYPSTHHLTLSADDLDLLRKREWLPLRNASATHLPNNCVGLTPVSQSRFWTDSASYQF